MSITVRSNLKSWVALLKTIVICAFGWVVISRFNEYEDLSVIWNEFLFQWQSANPWIIIIAIALMPVNWLVETFKWRVLLRPVSLSFRRALAGVLSGITLSLFTPNRTGEFGGRVLYVRSGDRWKGVIASLTGSFAQNLVYISVGLIFLGYFLMDTAYLPVLTTKGVCVALGIGVLGLFVVYFHLPQLVTFLAGKKPPRWLRKPWESLGHLAGSSRKRLAVAFGFSFVRYGIFTFQYVLLLTYFGVDVPWVWLTGGVAVIYLVQTSVPLPPLLDLVARNELGIALWIGFGANELSIVAAGLTIWVINLVIPACFGLAAIVTANVLRTFENDKAHIPPDAVEPSRRIWNWKSR